MNIRTGLSRAVLLLLLWSLLRMPTPACAAGPAEPRLAFAARAGGQWDIFSVRSDGNDLRRLTDDPYEDRAPAFSPDGSQLLFQSRREGNIDIYRLDLLDGSLTRLTDNPAYDGMPAWSPDGARIAFESMRNDDLDIFVMDANGKNITNLTEESPYGEIEPAWSPDGAHLVFASWRAGDKDLFSIALADGALTKLTDASSGEDTPAWSPDGRTLAFTWRQPVHRELALLATGGSQPMRLTWSTANEWPVWSPDGRELAWLEQNPFGWRLRRGKLANDGTLPALSEQILEGRTLAGPLSWNAQARPFGAPVSADMLEPRKPAAYAVRWRELDELPTPPPADPWVRLAHVTVPNERLNATIAPDFLALRQAILDASGHDFLSEMSDAWRPMDAASETSSYASWHKTGRAIDTLFDLRDRYGFPLMEVMREEIGGQVYWRVYIRCAEQNGSQGAPLREPPWDFSGEAREAQPDLGGSWKATPVGYYVDFSDLADAHGFERITALDRVDYSWTWHFLAIEYWHFQYDDGLSWYEAMRQVYPEEELSAVFTWEGLQEQGIIDWRIVFTGLPVPLREYRWALLQP